MKVNAEDYNLFMEMVQEVLSRHGLLREEDENKTPGQNHIDMRGIDNIEVVQVLSPVAGRDLLIKLLKHSLRTGNVYNNIN